MEAEVTQTHSEETFYRVLAWLHANQKRLFIGVGAVAALGLILGLVSWNKSETAATANAKLFELPISTSGGPSIIPPPPTAFLDLASRYPDTSAGEYALMFGAETLFVNGNYAESQQEFSKYVTEHPDGALNSVAQMGVAACVEAQGKTSDAIQKYQAVVSGYPNDLNVTEPAKLTMARLYEQENRPDQALNFYAELAHSQNPYDPWASEARERGELLLAKHPELRRTEAAPSAAQAPFSVGQAASQLPAPATPIPAPAQTPAPTPKPANQGLNLLNFPPASTNAAGKP
jgi:predicted negative regulator of RcsB-dependent stress response